MLCLSGLELYSRWVSLTGSLKNTQQVHGSRDNNRDEKSTEKVKIIYFL